MVKTKSSGVATMNYTYCIEKSKDMGGNLVVKEFYNEKLETWHFADYFAVQNYAVPEPDDESFQRCKRWLIENHPELTL